MTARAAPRRHRPPAVLATLTAAGVLLGGCIGSGVSVTATWDDTATTAASAAASAQLAGASASTASSTTTTISALAVPVAAGTCDTVTYTPSTASADQVGDLCRPDDGAANRDTVIVLVHGGGGTGGSRSDLVAWQEYWTAQGYVTLAIDYTLVDPDNDTGIYPLAEQNVKAAVQYARRYGTSLGIDQVVVQGHSAGARLGAIVSGTPDDPFFSGGELWLGVSDHIDGFIGFYGYYDGMQFNGESYYGGDGSEPSSSDSEAHAADVLGWTVLIHSTTDAIVDAAASADYVASLTAAGKDVEYIQTDDPAGHGFDGYDHDQLSDAGLMIAGYLQQVIEEESASIT